MRIYKQKGENSELPDDCLLEERKRSSDLKMKQNTVSAEKNDTKFPKLIKKQLKTELITSLFNVTVLHCSHFF